ncbi:MAG: sigma-70 family RNA polymerase sigma factor [Bacteroidales bacterium]|jgi:RNA polymerase sigma-70 factor (ECF subfamily)|nr:sigma-70 family RNA polymerase sigma factor [Bacteroidales bacterium]MDD4604370.1 sigma-70 family RNA polymerase sigma factor [Bacteroidales bacterium]
MQISDISDEALMLKAQRGELDAVGKLYERYSKKLFNFFIRITGNRDDSADLTQNVFYRVLKYRGSYNPEHQFRTWMYQMGRNCLTDYRKDSSKHPNIEDKDNVLSALLNDENSNNQVSQDAILFKAIENLPFEGKELLVMCKFQKLKYEEIAKITNDSVPNIKIKVHRTLKRLKEIYFEMEDA